MSLEQLKKYIAAETLIRQQIWIDYGKDMSDILERGQCMSPEELKEYIAAQTLKLQQIQARRDETLDTEEAHIEADNVIADTLIELGYKELVHEYRKIPKWYA